MIELIKTMSLLSIGFMLGIFAASFVTRSLREAAGAAAQLIRHENGADPIVKNDPHVDEGVRLYRLLLRSLQHCDLLDETDVKAARRRAM